MRAILWSAIIVIANCLSDPSSAQSSVVSEIAPHGKLRVAMIGANPVLVTRKADGTLGGVSADLGTFIADKLGLSLEPVVYADPEAYSHSFGTGEWDIAIGPRRPSEAEKVDFSPDFMFVDNLYVAAPGREFADASQVDKSGVRIAVAQAGAPDQFLSRTLKAAELVRVPGRIDVAVETLRSGKADVYGSNGQFVYSVAERLPGSKIVPGAFTTVPMAVALPKGRSPAAQSKLAEIVHEARAAGIARRAIEGQGLKGVRAAQN